MERKYLPSLSCLAFAVGLFLPVFIHAQDPADVPRDPSDWSAFVNGGDNPVMRDTFRMQTFRQLPEDNWPYELPDEATIIVNSDEPKLKGHYGSHSLKIPIKTRVDFAHFDLGIYQNAIIIPHFTCMYFPDDGILWAKTFRTNKADEAAIFTQSDVKDNLKELSFRSLTVSEMYPGISFFGTTESMQTSQSYYYIDSLYAYGDIPRYSLFTGQGGWNDTIRWSHLPTARRRSALIQGEATIDRPESADRILIGDGGLNLTARGSLKVNNLTLLSRTDGGAYLRSAGELDLGGQLTIEHTLPEKGKWYFFSLPFDLYLSGIDSNWTLGDSETTGTGDYLYLAEYDGDNRSLTQSATGNWRILDHPGSDALLIEKHKGYLIAIDEGATSLTIRFSSKANDIAADFAQTERLTISLPVSNDGENDGWLLCIRIQSCKRVTVLLRQCRYIIDVGVHFRSIPVPLEERVLEFSESKKAPESVSGVSEVHLYGLTTGTVLIVVKPRIASTAHILAAEPESAVAQSHSCGVSCIVRDRSCPFRLYMLIFVKHTAFYSPFKAVPRCSPGYGERKGSS